MRIELIQLVKLRPQRQHASGRSDTSEETAMASKLLEITSLEGGRFSPVPNGGAITNKDFSDWGGRQRYRPMPMPRIDPAACGAWLNMSAQSISWGHQQKNAVHGRALGHLAGQFDELGRSRHIAAVHGNARASLMQMLDEGGGFLIKQGQDDALFDVFCKYPYEKHIK